MQAVKINDFQDERIREALGMPDVDRELTGGDLLALAVGLEMRESQLDQNRELIATLRVRLARKDQVIDQLVDCLKSITSCE